MATAASNLAWLDGDHFSLSVDSSPSSMHQQNLTKQSLTEFWHRHGESGQVQLTPALELSAPANCQSLALRLNFDESFAFSPLPNAD